MSANEPADVLITHAIVVTMNPRREVITDGAVAIRGREIAAVGKTADLRQRFTAPEEIDGTRFVVCPGLINCHIHTTGEPITRGFVPDDTTFEENVFGWLCPLYSVANEDEERISAQLAAAELLKSGATTFLEAGTIRFVDAVVDGLAQIGIRARFGEWTWDRPEEPAVYRKTTAEAIASLERLMADHREHADGRLQAWPMIVGHTTCSPELWEAAKRIADECGVGLNFHMSPAAMDPAGFLKEYGIRPMEFLARHKVLDRNVVMVHCVHVDDNEVRLIAEHRANVAHCPTTALKVAYGVTQIGKMPEMVERGINVVIGTDGNNASNYSDMMRATYLVAGLFKDARRNTTMFPAEKAYEMATLGGARALLAEDQIGSIEPGKRADLVLHDRRRPEWTPLLNVANQLVYSADGRSVHTVFVDGRKVVENYRLTTIDEDRLYEDAQRAGEAICRRTGLPDKSKWPRI
jgi:cytosine/adenosine deaminase-related metal-dependent hydrolase